MSEQELSTENVIEESTREDIEFLNQELSSKLSRYTTACILHCAFYGIDVAALEALFFAGVVSYRGWLQEKGVDVLELGGRK